MKQYTNEQQTAKLIELGFREPESKVGGKVIYEPDADLEIGWEYAYSIGELIEMLPSKVNGWEFDIHHDYHFERWICDFDSSKYYGVATELIDALYNLILKLKEEGVI